jgi:VWFA-related protein
MGRSVEMRFDRRAIGLLVTLGLMAFASSLRAQTPPDPSSAPKTDVAPASSPVQSTPAAPSTPAANASGSNQSSAEVSSHDTAPTFKVRVNLVLVRVVVRDQQGNVIPNLKKEDFQLQDNRKPQTISTFSVETPASHAIVPASPETVTQAEEPSSEAPEAAATLPQRFVSVVFDDTNMQTQDTLSIRAAASHLFSSMAPSDRVGIYTTSGQFSLEFTSNAAQLHESLLHIVPHPLASSPGMHECPEISYYEADRIVNYSDTQALAIATQDTLACSAGSVPALAAQALAQTAAERTASIGDSQTEYVYRHLQDALRRLSAMPGQRVMVFVSPGFIVTTNTREGGDFIDRANRANVVINVIDARGLYTPDQGDISEPTQGSPVTMGPRSTYLLEAQFAQSDILAQFADGTGGTYFHNRNDLDQGLRNAIVAPPLSYLIGFSPQNLKVDGRYHVLKVSLAGKQKFLIQARHGYYAPRTVKDPVETAKEEIQEAIFSQDEIHDVPIDLQTQFFKTDPTQARLAVLTHVDVKGIHFRKAEGRSRDDLTFATAIFDENGNFVTGGEKVVEMRLLDPTLDRLNHAGFTVKSSFDVKPGTYLVRMVVRDAEGSQMAARNGAVVIPY